MAGAIQMEVRVGIWAFDGTVVRDLTVNADDC